jgi:radical SAM superfamily enzyme YgiQ (UPF0313 family)
MNILIIVPKFKDSLEQYYEFPLGLSFISAVLKEKNYNVKVLNLNHRDEVLEYIIKSYIEKYNIDIICTGGISFHFNKIKEIIEITNKIKPNIISIVGGGVLSSEPKLVFEELNVTYGVIGEGEIVIANLIDAIENKKDISNVNGVIYTKDEKTFITKPQDNIKDLDSLPYPDYDGFDNDNFLKNIPKDIYFIIPPTYKEDVGNSIEQYLLDNNISKNNIARLYTY